MMRLTNVVAFADSTLESYQSLSPDFIDQKVKKAPAQVELAASIENQLHMCRTAAPKNGWVIADDQIYTDSGASGRIISDMTGLRSLLQAAKSQPRPLTHLLVEGHGGCHGIPPISAL